MEAYVPAEEVAWVPNSIEIAEVSGARGTLYVKAAAVSWHGEEAPASPDSEPLSGPRAGRKWKASCRVVEADGSLGMTVDRWLELRGVDLVAGQFRVRPHAALGFASAAAELEEAAELEGEEGKAEPVALPTEGATAVPAAAAAAAAQAQASAPAKAKGPSSRAVAPLPLPGQITSEAMRAHLAGVFIGYRPGDPTVGQLPPEPPEPSTAGDDAGAPAVVFDLRVMSHEELAQAALATTGGRDPCGELLDVPPGAPPGRIAYFTGQQQQPARAAAAKKAAAAAAAGGGPGASAGGAGGSASGMASPSSDTSPSRRPQPAGSRGSFPSALADAELVAALDPYLSVPGQPVPWADLGVKAGPLLMGRELDLRRLWDLVSALGGWEGASNGRQWGRLAVQLGADLSRITNGGYLVKLWYQRFLLPYERAVAPGRGGGSGGGGSSAEADSPPSAGPEVNSPPPQEEDGGPAEDPMLVDSVPTGP